MPNRAFLSHSSLDKERFVLGFAGRLQHAGVRLWLDDWEMLPGDTLTERIIHYGVRESDVVIIVLSDNSIDSNWVREELDQALVRKIEGTCRIIPILLDDVKVPPVLKTIFYQRITDCDSYEAEFQRILLAINRQPPITQEPTQLAETEVTMMARRYQHVFELITRGFREMTLPKMAQILNLNRIGDLEDVIRGISEPTIAFGKHFCSTFGVNSAWLLEGKDFPFQSKGLGLSTLKQCVNRIESVSPQHIYFIKDDTKTGQATLLLKPASWQYVPLDAYWHISDRVGGTGRRQLHDLYRLIEWLRDTDYSCSGRVLSREAYYNIINGMDHAGEHLRNQPSYWWDDLTDVHHKYANADRYRDYYGSGFVKAQTIIKSQMEGRPTSL